MILQVDEVLFPFFLRGVGGACFFHVMHVFEKLVIYDILWQ